MCPCCGHRGLELQGASGQRALRCERCGGDLYTRPPRSYAEMEGIPDDDVSSMEPMWLDAIPAAVLGDDALEIVRPLERPGFGVWRLAGWGLGLITVGFVLGAVCWATFGTL